MATKAIEFIESLEKAIRDNKAIVTKEDGKTVLDVEKIKPTLEEAGFSETEFAKQTKLAGQIVTAAAAVFGTTDLPEFIKQGDEAQRSCSYTLGGTKYNITQKGVHDIRNPTNNEVTKSKGHVSITINNKSMVKLAHVRNKVREAYDGISS